MSKSKSENSKLVDKSSEEDETTSSTGSSEGSCTGSDSDSEVDTTETSFSSKKSEENQNVALLKYNHKTYSVVCDAANTTNFANMKKDEPKRDVDTK